MSSSVAEQRKLGGKTILFGLGLALAGGLIPAAGAAFTTLGFTTFLFGLGFTVWGGIIVVFAKRRAQRANDDDGAAGEQGDEGNNEAMSTITRLKAEPDIEADAQAFATLLNGGGVMVEQDGQKVYLDGKQFAHLKTLEAKP